MKIESTQIKKWIQQEVYNVDLTKAKTYALIKTNYGKEEYYFDTLENVEHGYLDEYGEFHNCRYENSWALQITLSDGERIYGNTEYFHYLPLVELFEISVGASEDNKLIRQYEKYWYDTRNLEVYVQKTTNIDWNRQVLEPYEK